MIDPKLVENWDIVFALAEKGCGHSASYEAVVWDPRKCGGPLDNVQWVLTVPCPEGCSSSPPPGLPTNPPPCDPDFEGSNETLIGCCEGIVQVECTGTCCLCGGVQCEPSETCCDNVCVDLQTDHDHCSSCTIACEPSETCCTGDCIDTESLQTDVANCGYCGNTCLAGESCCSGSCVNVMGSDTSNCGGCGVPCASGKICDNGVCKDPCALNNCSWTWGEETVTGCCSRYVCSTENEYVFQSQYPSVTDCSVDSPPNIPCDGSPESTGFFYLTWSPEPCTTTTGCCKTYTCLANDPSNGNAQLGFYLTSLVPTEENCSTGDSTCCFDYEAIGVPDRPTCLGAEYKIWSPPEALEPCGQCLPEDCNVTINWTWLPSPSCPEDPSNPVFLTGSWTTPDDCPAGCTGKVAPGMPSDVCLSGQTAFQNCVCMYPSFHALSTDEDENGTVRALAGSWTATATCPQGCNCPGEAPTADGTDGQVVTYECASCVPACGEGQECCGGECKNTNDDNANCGGCGIPCLFPLGFCCNGECCTEDGCCTVDGTPTCKDIYNDPDFCGDCVTFCSGPGSTTPQTCCDGECKDLRTDPNNCRYCGSVCAEGETCCYDETAWGCQNIKDSTFNCGSCNFQCAFDPALNIQCCNYECIPLNVSVNHCGSCYHPCGINETCCNGNCCPAGNTCCDGNCVNRNTDNNNCGNCGTVCVGGHSCVNGVCLACNPPCLAAGTACCNNSCIDIWSDESNCGSCGYACAPGFICCGGVCKNPLNDMYNCGDCGIECPQGINQINLWQCCNGVCRNLKTDPDNCGICGLTCQEPPGDTFTVPKCFLGNCAEPECECQGYEQGMPPQPEPNDVAFVASCVGNTVSCDGSCYFDAVGGAWVLHEEPGYSAFYGTCGQEPDYTYCADDRLSCVDDKLACVGDIYFCVNNIEGQDMPTYCIPKASFNAETQAKIGEYIGAENCAAGCSGDGSVCVPNPCPNGKTCCDSQCVDMQTDTAHCGSCDAAPCAEGQACKDGVCAECPSPCAEGETCCEGGTTCCKVCCNDGCCADSDYCGEGGGCVECECTVPGTTCCNGECCDAGTICCGSGNNKACCTADQYCDGNGRCTSCQTPVCYPEQKCCSGTCIDNPCGDCPNSCTEGQMCCENECTDVGTDTNCSDCGDACGEGTKCCGGSCIDVLSDLENCGDCEVVAEELCCDGVPTAKGSNENCLSCGDTADPDNPTDPTSCCPKPVVIAGAPDESTFFITNTNTDDENCGGCGNVADTSPYVKEKCCDGEIVSLLTDDDNCGACGTRALAPKICCPHVGPPDAYGDPPPPTATQVNPNTDDKNCGGCGNVVDTSDQVQQKCCEGEPVSLLTDDDNCGACGVRVEAPKICCPHWGPLDIYGELPRPTATQVDPNTDDENCGGCGNAVDTSDQVQQKCCDGEPVNTLTDNDNCGGCGIRTVGTDICCPKWGPPNIYGDLPKPTATIVDPNTDNDNCGGCGNKCNAVESGAECPESGDPPTTKCVNGECVPCGTCKLPTESQQAFLLGSAPTFWGQRTTIPCTYDACPPSDPPPNPSLPAKTCFGGCEYKAIGNVNNLQWELVSCECYDSCNVPECTGAFAEAHGNACPSVGYCSAGEGPCASCRYLDYDNPSEYKCTAPWGHDAVGCNYDILGTYGANPSNYTCCDHEHPGGTLCNGGCPSVYEDESEHFPTCAPCGGSCPDGLTCCGDFPNDTCVDTKNDEGHCGTCPNVCLAEQTCCDGSCKNLDNDKDHCGSCPNKCTGDLECCGGECKDIYGNDDSNCGSCGNVCITGHCCGGDCKDTDTDESNCGLLCIACDAGETCCGGSCVNTDTDEANCGGCEQPCAGGECCGGTCRDSSYFQTSETDCGGCEQPCAAGETCCAGSCIDTISLETDEANCGNCGIVCAESETCCGECIATSSLQTDEANCGGCGQPCTAEQTCCAGSCVATSSLETDEANCGECGNACTAGQTCCAGTCRDSSYFQTDEANCGECGNDCEPGEECILGSCNLPPLTIKIYFQAYGCGGDCVYPYNSPSCVSSALTPGSRSMSYTTSWGPGGTISNSSSAISFGAVNVPVGTSITVSLSGYAGSGTLSHTRAATYPGSPPNPPTHTFFFNGYDDQGC